MKRGKGAAASSISYRREDTADAVAHLHHSLAQQLGEGKVLQGGRRLEAREDFVRKEIESALVRRMCR